MGFSLLEEVCGCPDISIHRAILIVPETAATSISLLTRLESKLANYTLATSNYTEVST